jgi:hypothetical protein
MLPAAAGASVAAATVAQAEKAPGAAAPSQPKLRKELLDKVNQIVESDTSRVLGIFRDIHRHLETLLLKCAQPALSRRTYTILALK